MLHKFGKLFLGVIFSKLTQKVKIYPIKAVINNADIILL